MLRRLLGFISETKLKFVARKGNFKMHLNKISSGKFLKIKFYMLEYKNLRTYFEYL